MIRSGVKGLLGAVIIVLGVIALFTPFTPGSWLILIGLEFLGIHLFAGGPEGMRKLLHDVRRRFEGFIFRNGRPMDGSQ